LYHLAFNNSSHYDSVHIACPYISSFSYKCELFVAVVNRNTFSLNIECGSWLRETAFCGVKSVTADFLMEIRVEGERYNSA